MTTDLTAPLVSLGDRLDGQLLVAGFVAAARWTDPAEDDLRIAAARRCAASLEPYASGAYVNTLTDEGAAGLRRAYPPNKLTRLTALKDVYDPDNVFHLNQNMPPSRIERIAN